MKLAVALFPSAFEKSLLAGTGLRAHDQRLGRAAGRLHHGLSALKGKTFQDGKNIFKFGKRVHLERALNEGCLRVLSSCGGCKRPSVFQSCRL